MGRTAVVVKEITPEMYLTSHEVAKLLQRNPSSINKWTKEGRIEFFQTPGGHRRMRAIDIVEFLTKYRMPVPEALATMTVLQQAPEKVAKKSTKKR